MRRLLSAFLLCLAVLAGTAHAQAEKRVALVIGNSAYRSAPLKNPTNDARDMAAKLRTLGFEVVERSNLTTKQIAPALREFRSRLAPGAVALFFYAGHGLQIKGVNYLPAVDAEIASEEDVPLQSLDVNKVLEMLEESKTRLNLMFLDACRNNPFVRSFRSAADGLAKVSAPSGTLISFATRPGSVAADGEGRNGLYTSQLLVSMSQTGQPIEQVLKRVVSGVKAASKGRQEPWMEGSIEGDFCFGVCGVAVAAPAPALEAAEPSGAAIELAYWDGVKDSRSAESYQAYLNRYPDGRFADIARARVRELSAVAPALRPAERLAPEIWTGREDEEFEAAFLGDRLTLKRVPGKVGGADDTAYFNSMGRHSVLAVAPFEISGTVSGDRFVGSFLQQAYRINSVNCNLEERRGPVEGSVDLAAGRMTLVFDRIDLTMEAEYKNIFSDVIVCRLGERKVVRGFALELRRQPPK